MTSVVVDNNSNYTLPANTFTAPAGKYFAGWAESANGAVISGTSVKVTGDKTLYAVWKDQINSVNIVSIPTNNFLNNKYKTNKAKIQTTLEKLAKDADVMVITGFDQMVAVKNNAPILDDILGYLYDANGGEGKYIDYYFARVWQRGTATENPNDGWAGHLILSKYPIIQEQTIFQIEQGDGEIRQAGYVTLQVGDKTLDVFAMNNATGYGNWTHNNNALLNAAKNSTADGWVAMGNTGLRVSDVTTMSGANYLNQTLNAHHDSKDTGPKRAYILTGESLTLSNVVEITDVANSSGTNYINHYQFATATITFN